MESIILNGKTVPLSYKTREMKTLQEEIAPLAQLTNAIIGRASDEDSDLSLYGSPQHLDAVAKAVRILGNAALRRAGEEEYLTDEYVLDWMDTDEVAAAVTACVRTINKANESEIPPAEEEGPVDVTLEKLKKKETKGG